VARGFTWAVYTDDLGGQWAVQVDSDYVLQPQRGWDNLVADGLPALPRGWSPRLAVGIEPDGRRHGAVVASLVADLWTGGSSTFDIEANDGSIVTCTLIQTLEERRSNPRPD
jgi:hypothetical protein